MHKKFNLHLMAAFQSLKGTYRVARERLFTRACTRCNGFKLKENRCKKFTVRLLRHWQRFPREVVDVPSLEMLKTKLYGSLIKLIQWKVSLPMTENLEIDDL